ncbi:LysR family transcriptional regulator [Asticcacaulis solisilvae]|uniref:LysR family transcriptional regulator n=1 Tax=Asticcacaulis solisilvae TaxID=1217274 RepID=UPI003FD8550F
MRSDLNALEFADLRAFFVVAETGSFTRAAHRLEAAKSIVSRRVARLEQALSVALLQRTSSGALLTEEGQVYYELARAAMGQLDSAAESVGGALQDVSGRIRVTIPIYFGVNYLASLFAEFMEMHPSVELDINISDDKVDVVREGFDIAVRTGHLGDSALIGRLLCHSRRTLVASPAYLERSSRIERPEDLCNHRILHYSSLYPQELWRYHAGDEIVPLRVTPQLRSNSATTLMAAVTAGQGLTVLPSYVTHTAVAGGQAVEVLPEVNWGVSPITLLTPPGRNSVRRVRTLLDFLVLRFNSRTV